MTELAKLVGRLQATPTVQWDRVHLMAVLVAADTAVAELEKRCTYLEDSLAAATCGELPERFDLNQLLLAQRAKAYLKWMAETRHPADILRPAGSNDEMVQKK
jgi:hypothetical protein